MEATEHLFPVILFVMRLATRTFESVDEIIKCDCGYVYDALQGGFNFLSLLIKSYSVTIQMKAAEQSFPVVRLFFFYVVQGGSKF